MSKKIPIYIYILFIICIFIVGCQKRYRVKVIFKGNEELNTIIITGKEYYDKGDYEKALSYYKQVEPYVQTGDLSQEEVGNLYNMVGQCYMYLADYNSALDNYKKSLDICIAISDQDGEMNNYMSMQEVYYGLGDVEKSIEYGEMAERLIIKLYGEGSKYLISTYVTMGRVYNKLGENEEANRHFQNALEIAKALEGEDGLFVAKVYLEMADVYQDTGKTDIQKECLEKSLAIYENHENKGMAAYVYGNLGRMYENTKEYEEAIRCYTKSIAYEEESGNSLELSKYYYWRAVAYFRKNDNDSFINDNKTAYHICQGLPVQSDFTDYLKERIIENFKYYYDTVFDGDKSQGFDSWLAGIVE